MLFDLTCDDYDRFYKARSAYVKLLYYQNCTDDQKLLIKNNYTNYLEKNLFKIHTEDQKWVLKTLCLDENIVMFEIVDWKIKKRLFPLLPDNDKKILFSLYMNEVNKKRRFELVTNTNKEKQELFELLTATNEEKRILFSQLTITDKDKKKLFAQLADTNEMKKKLFSQLTVIDQDKKKLFLKLTNTDEEIQRLFSQLADTYEDKNKLFSILTDVSDEEKKELFAKLKLTDKDKKELFALFTEEEQTLLYTKNERDKLIKEKEEEEKSIFVKINAPISSIINAPISSIIKSSNLVWFMLYGFINMLGIFFTFLLLVESDIANYLLPSTTLVMHTLALIFCFIIKTTSASKGLAVVNLVIGGLVSVCYVAWLVFFKLFTPLIARILILYFKFFPSEITIIICGYCAIIFSFVASVLCFLNNWSIFKSVEIEKKLKKTETTQKTSGNTTFKLKALEYIC